MLKSFSFGCALLLLSGCTSYGVVDNKPQSTIGNTTGYSIRAGGGSGWGSGDVALMLAFSGGGTRAAVLAYGVLEELRDTNIVVNGQPSLKETISAMSDVQLHRYNVATVELLQKSVKRWARDLSTRGRNVSPYFIHVGFRDVEQPELLQFFNQVPTSFSLTDEQVDKLIAAGRELLRKNPDFQRLVASLGGERTARI